MSFTISTLVDKVENNGVFHLNLPSVKIFFSIQRHLFSPWLFYSLHFSLAVTAAVPDIPAFAIYKRRELS